MNALLRTLISGFVATVYAAPAMSADAFPSRPIRIVVNSAAGGQLDVQTRLVGQEMSKNLGRPVVIDSRTGADGVIGIRFVKAAPADGYTILSSANTFAQNPALKKDIGYDVKEFVGVGMISQAPLIMVTASSHPEKTVADVIAQAKANPEKMTFSSGGVGTSSHMAAALFLSYAGVKMLHVPYKGNAASRPDVLTGRININFDGASGVISHVKEGRLRALAITTPQRFPTFPEIPTLAEQGLAKYDYSIYTGLIVPAATPRDVVGRLAEVLRTTLKSETVRESFRRDGFDPGTMTPEEFTAYLRQDEQRISKLAQELGWPKE